MTETKAGSTNLSDQALDRYSKQEAEREEASAARAVHGERHLALEATIAERWIGHGSAHSSHDHIHSLEHAHEQELARNEETRLGESMVAHTKEHASNREAIETALAAVDKLAEIHAQAHAREHLNHEARHRDGQEAIAKAEAAMDKRLAGLNEVREQQREQGRSFATNERLDAFISSSDRRFADTTKHTDERYEENRRRIEALEKGDVKSEGRSLGQGAVIAIIVGAIGVVGTILGILIVIANFVTGA